MTTVVYSTVYSDADQRKHQSSASLAFVWGIHRASYAANVSIWLRHHVDLEYQSNDIHNAKEIALKNMSKSNITRSQQNTRQHGPCAWHIGCIVVKNHPSVTLYCDVIMGAMTSQIISLTIVYSTVHSSADQRNHRSSVSLAFVWGIHRLAGEFPTQMARNVENFSIWWRHHNITFFIYPFYDPLARLFNCISPIVYAAYVNVVSYTIHRMADF